MDHIRYENIFKCKAGQVIAKDVFDERGVFLVAKNVVLNEYLIKRLISLSITRIPIIDMVSNGNDSKQVTAQTVSASYNKDLESYKRILRNLAAGKNLNYEEINALTVSVQEKIHHNYLLFDCLSQLKGWDEYTYTHSVNVALYAMLIARWLRLPEGQVNDVIQAGLLHDIGKVRVSDEILNKPGPLLPEEFEQVKKHSVFGYQLLSNIPQINEKIKVTVLMHHEREDGGGYPLAISGVKIPLYAKIISVADVYDALTSERVYKKRVTPFDTFREFEKIGYGHFDTRVMMTFLSNVANYYVGAKVKMNTEEVGKIAYIPPHSISRPIIVLENAYIDLSKDPTYQIVEMI